MPTTERKEAAVLTSIELEDFMANAAPGATCVYHRGHLACDIDSNTSIMCDERRIRLIGVASIAFALCCRGIAHLLQRREGDDFVYLAVRSYKDNPFWSASQIAGGVPELSASRMLRVPEAA